MSSDPVAVIREALEGAFRFDQTSDMDLFVRSLEALEELAAGVRQLREAMRENVGDAYNLLTQGESPTQLRGPSARRIYDRSRAALAGSGRAGDSECTPTNAQLIANVNRLYGQKLAYHVAAILRVPEGESGFADSVRRSLVAEYLRKPPTSAYEPPVGNVKFRGESDG